MKVSPIGLIPQFSYTGRVHILCFGIRCGRSIDSHLLACPLALKGKRKVCEDLWNWSFPRLSAGCPAAGTLEVFELWRSLTNWSIRCASSVVFGQLCSVAPLWSDCRAALYGIRGRGIESLIKLWLRQCCVAVRPSDRRQLAPRNWLVSSRGPSRLALCFNSWKPSGYCCVS